MDYYIDIILDTTRKEQIKAGVTQNIVERQPVPGKDNYYVTVNCSQEGGTPVLKASVIEGNTIVADQELSWLGKNNDLTKSILRYKDDFFIVSLT